VVSAGRNIERLIAQDDWVGARKAIREELRRTPESHWLIPRLALTYYEQRRYAKALELETRALQLAPKCPLALWGFAGAKEMLGEASDALRMYTRLIRRGAARLAHGPCGDGARWARGLVADCHYRIGRIREAKGDLRGAAFAYRRHLDLRRTAASIYEAEDARSRLHALLARRGARSVRER
jgi:predicted Zn-dependent protease